MIIYPGMFRIQSLQKVAYGLLVGGCLALSGQATAQNDNTVAIGELLAVDGNQQEAELAGLIQQSLDSQAIGGAFYSYQGSLVSGMSPGDVALKVLERNLSLKIAGADNELAQQAKLEAQAVFDPVLSLNVGLTRDESHERTETGTVFAKVFYPQYDNPDTGDAAPLGEIILPEEVRDETGIEKIIFSNEDNFRLEREERENETIFASKKDPNGAQTGTQFDVALAQLTPWGVSYDLTLTTVNKKTFYDSDGHSFDAPWASKLLLNVELPINDFGEDSSAGLASRLAALEQKRQDWQLKSRINTVLAQAADAYLALVGSAEQYRINGLNRQLTEEQYVATKRRFDSRNATAYELSQIEAELALAKSSEENAAKNYLTASDALLALTSENGAALQGRVLVPVGYTQWLATALELNTLNARQTALDNRPLLQAGMLEVAQAQVEQRNAVLRMRPDIRLKAALGLEQNGSVYGYESLTDSLANVFDPDFSSQSLSAEYRYPLGNAGVKARKQIADARLQDSELVLQTARQQVELDVQTAINRLQTAKSVKLQAEQRLQSAEKAYTSLQRLARNGSATQNEIVNGLRTLQNARTANLQAAIEIKSAEAALLAAQGIIDKNYARWVAKNDFEHWRLAQLGSLGAFEFFIE
ncbi:MAG: TolC family protein [Gammaproteobacteria bacterium]|nr:TolC family protein [Gammaproteobacteria bacterium]